MITMVQGTRNAENSSASTCASLAVISALKYNQKTLVLQLTKISVPEILSILIGELKKEDAIIEGTGIYHINDKGIDALIKRAETSKLSKEHFDSSCDQLLNKANMLDVTAITTKDDFLLTLQEKSVRNIFKYAKETYDNIFVLLDSEDKKIMPYIMRQADVIITCLSQSSTRDIYNVVAPITEEEAAKEEQKLKKKANPIELQLKKKKADTTELFVATDYENMSQYSTNYIKRQYSLKKVFKIPHNTGYKDACISGTLLSYFFKNIDNQTNDDNFDFMQMLNIFATAIFGNTIIEDEINEEECPEIINKEENQIIEPEPLESCDTLNIEEVVVKKGIFKREKQFVITDIKDLPEEIEDDILIKDEELFLLDKTESETEVENTATVKEEFVIQTESKNDEYIPIKKTTFKKSKKGFVIKEFDDELVDIPTVSLPQHELEELSDNKTNNNTSMEQWVCPECEAHNTTKFCIVCGHKKEVTWICPKCNTVNINKFCGECGTKNPF